ncbi:MAG: hypothetical protein JSV80_14595 [Acidobacteriota bacterium]|nr:MAG: hypothetical protein JSV80_14595 [Acidobacteriota bacterium]
MNRKKQMRRIALIFLGGLSFALMLLPAMATPDPVQAELSRVESLYRAVNSYHVLLQGDGVTSEMVSSALYDVERYVEELDNKLETSQLFIEDRSTLDKMKNIVAKAHMQAALLHAKGVDLEGSITQYERVIDLLGYNPVEWEETLERSGRLGLLTGAREMVFETATPKQIVQDLQVFWSVGIVSRVRVEEFATSQRKTLELQRIGGPTDPFSQAAYELAAKRFAERVGEGLDQFRIVLPEGRYEVVASSGGVEPRKFAVVRGSVPDPLILNPNRFSFSFSSPDERCRPQLTLNNITVRGLTDLPYGTYRVDAPAECPLRLPDRITVEQKSEVTLRTEPERMDLVREGEPIFLFITTPPGSTYTLRM